MEKATLLKLRNFSVLHKALGCDIHILKIEKDQYPGDLLPYLSAEEKAKASNFVFEKHRNQFILTRAATRRLFSNYLDLPPDQIFFKTNQQGKPSFNLDTTLQFNISHTDHHILCAIAADRELGIDIEALSFKRPVMAIAKRFFSNNEHAFLAALPTEQQYHEFFKLWTLKEAYVKCTGTGIAHSWQALDFSAGLVLPGIHSKRLLLYPDTEAAIVYTGEVTNIIVL